MRSGLAKCKEGSRFLGLTRSTTLQIIITKDLHSVCTAQQKDILYSTEDTPILRK